MVGDLCSIATRLRAAPLTAAVTTATRPATLSAIETRYALSPTLVISPSTDEIFAEYAKLAVERGATTIDDLERQLRTVYPRAAVHARELSGEPVVVWYVYRDGHWAGGRDAHAGQ
jgi:hypothetical protein